MQINGRHLTAMVVAISAAAILTPVSVGAATGSFVNIRDPFTTAASGQARVVAGALSVNQEQNSFTRFNTLIDNGSDKLTVAIPANKTLRLGTVALARTFGSDTIRVVAQFTRPTTTCSATGRSSISYPLTVVLSPDQSMSNNYTPMLALPRKPFATCLDVYITGGVGNNDVNAAITGTIS